MKKILLVLLTSLLFILVGCDYPEKSFNALNKRDIPMEVTEDFMLPRGVYAPFIWTSNNEAITIDEQAATVTQSDEDVLVTLTATINKTSRTFEVLVLKTGSITVYERAETAHQYLTSTYERLTSDNTLMPKELEGLYIRYSRAYSFNYVGLFEDENKNTYLSNNFRPTNEKVEVGVYYYKDQDFKILVNSMKLNLFVSPMDETDPFLLAFQQLNIHNYINNNGQIVISSLKLNDIIEFENTEDIKYLLSYDAKYLKKLNDYQLKVIKRFDEDIYLHFGLTITIGNMNKNLSMLLSMDE